MSPSPALGDTFIACVQPGAIECTVGSDDALGSVPGILGEGPVLSGDAGTREVLVRGLLAMAWLGRVLTNWQPQARLRQLSTRLQAPFAAGTVVTCMGAVTEVFCVDGENRVTVRLSAGVAGGANAVVGEAVVALP